ncbi:VOC family protein [Aminobacter carboxidus]|uniref:Catechol 2,3-dioxygenase-like lactoylglutathione lyase family enzyme n=1 Tax=Aminobacter carboxidus TaxID=376165 RepID=A0A8E1WFT3_9HYPH|nr:MULTISPECIES: VOC family protein [Aminobacter carboxidus group]MBB6467129.1 catechol 2,3-dioxygenase-like lactoylglutathione lyase family enzyme [Aminobacter lissarensis]MBE1207249.1 VOC family protein [Aminobacter carboxidus]
MFDHVGFRVRDLAASRRFYDAVASAIGLSTIDNSPTSFLLGKSASEPIPFLWIGTDQPSFWSGGHVTSASPLHLAFSVDNHAKVNAFHKAALENGGIDNGMPGPRGPAEMGYYGAYVLDPDGNNIEAGCRN